MKAVAALFAILSGLAASATLDLLDDPPAPQQFAEVVLAVEGMT